jgi:hypothetical protein
LQVAAAAVLSQQVAVVLVALEHQLAFQVVEQVLNPHCL